VLLKKEIPQRFAL